MAIETVVAQLKKERAAIEAKYNADIKKLDTAIAALTVKPLPTGVQPKPGNALAKPHAGGGQQTPLSPVSGIGATRNP